MIEYLAYLLRPSTYADVATLEACPNVLRDTLLWTAALLAVYAAFPVCCSRLFPSFATLEPKTQREAAGYASALVHHLYVVPLCVSFICLDMATPLPASTITPIIPASTGYLLADLIFTGVPGAFEGDFTYLLHHCLGLLLPMGALVSPLKVAFYLPHLMITEASTIFLAATWALRKAGRGEGSLLHDALFIVFAVVFFATRNINFQLITAISVRPALQEAAPSCRFCGHVSCHLPLPPPPPLPHTHTHPPTHKHAPSAHACRYTKCGKESQTCLGPLASSPLWRW